MGGLLASDSVLLQILLEERALSPDCRLVCSNWARAAESRIQKVTVRHVDHDGAHLGRFLASLPKLEALQLDKRFRMAHIRPHMDKPDVGGKGEEVEHHGTVREREQEMIRAACSALRACCPQGLSASFCRLSAPELSKILR